MASICIIPARGGSKRIPRKNIKPFLGKPIIAYSIEAALASGTFDEVMVSTDDQEIAEVSKRFGANVPFLRSPELGGDMVMTAEVLIEVLDRYVELGMVFGRCCCLYATAPFINPERLKSGMHMLEEEGTDSVLPVVRFSYPPQRGQVIRNGHVEMLHPENYNVRSQDLEPMYHDVGQFYCIKSDVLRQERRLFCGQTCPVELPESEVQDIDSEEDWKIAEMKYQILSARRR